MSDTSQVVSGMAAVNGTQLYYEVAGQGHPLTLIHGGLVDRRLWDDQFADFAQHYRVIRYDLRGFGDSAIPTGRYSMLEDLRSLLHLLGVEKTYLMGLSMGGALAIDFTLTQPQLVDALIPVAAGISGSPPSEEAGQQWAEIDALAKQGKREEAVELENHMWTDGPNRAPGQVDANVRRRVHEMNLRNWQRQPAEMPAPFEYDNDERPDAAINRLAEISVPTLVIVGDADQPDVLTAADKLVGDIAGARKVVIPGTAHHLNMEEPEVFNTIVLAFLAAR